MGRRSTVTRGSRSSGRRSRRCSSPRSPSSVRSCSRRTTTPARTRSGSPSPRSSSPGSSSIPARAKVTSGQLVLPVDQPVKLTLHSVDVIHSFWVPEFGQKSDAVPGIETTLVITPNRTGQFALMCTELCGLGHATMRAHVRVVKRSRLRQVPDRRFRRRERESRRDGLHDGRLRGLPHVHAGRHRCPGRAESRRDQTAGREAARGVHPRVDRRTGRRGRRRLSARCDAEDLQPDALRRAA